MRPRHPARRSGRPAALPRLWLMTDERLGDGLWDALARLPRGSGVVFRHYGLSPGDRRALLTRVVTIARARRLVLVGSGIDGPDGTHHGRRRGRLLTQPVHDRREAVAAIRQGADAVFVSPVFATRSHVGARALGRVKLGLMIRGLPMPVIALGGMHAQRFRGLRGLGVYGWAGIDAFSTP